MQRIAGYLALFGLALYGYAKVFNEDRLTGGALIFMLLGGALWLFAPRK